MGASVDGSSQREDSGWMEEHAGEVDGMRLPQRLDEMACDGGGAEAAGCGDVLDAEALMVLLVGGGDGGGERGVRQGGEVAHANAIDMYNWRGRR